MKKALVYDNSILAGVLIKDMGEYSFIYDEEFLNDKSSRAISLTLQKQKSAFKSKILFPFFFNMLSEGRLKNLQCRNFKIDENDHFSRLLKSNSDTIGAITVKEVTDE